MRWFIFLLSLLPVVCGPTHLYADEKTTRDLYGPVLSTHMAADGRKLGTQKQLRSDRLGNYVFRGRLISLDSDNSSNICYDTDHMRVASAWSGGYIDWKGVYKNQGPAIAGTIHFQTPVGPGWSHDGLWDDPRKPKEGPLPSNWAKYRGMYLHGRKVVLSYTVDDCRVLEMPASKTQGQMTVFLRNFAVGPSCEPLGLLVAEELGAKGGIAKGGDFAFRHKKELAEDTIAGLEVKGGHIVARVVGAPKQTRWEVENGRLLLFIPASQQSNSFQVVISRISKGQEKEFAEFATGEVEDLHKYTKGGPARWPETLTSKGRLGRPRGAYVTDELMPPTDNPWGAKFRFGAMDFFDDGRAALSTWDGDVWIVSGIDKGLSCLKWRRYAAGLQQPLGLKIVNGVIYTAGRDQITRLHDLNNDGEADFYENFNNDAGLTPQRHEFVMDLRTDKEGNFYYCRSGHYMPSLRGENCCVMKLPPDGSKLEVFARGLREPNGMGIGPDGFMTVGDNEGNGIPQTPIYQLRKGAYYGFRTSLRAEDRSLMPPWSKAILWLPKTVDRSAGSQIWVTSDKWGPLKGHMLHTSYGHCKLFHIMLDRTHKEAQGAAFMFPLFFRSGIMRGRFHPKDGQLYLCGLRGWDTNAVRDGTFCRVRYTGKPTYMPLAYRVSKEGIHLTFDGSLDPKLATDPRNWALDQYSVKFGKYPAKPKEEVRVRKISLTKDERGVLLHLAKVEPVTNLNITYQIGATDGELVAGTIHATINSSE